MWKLKTAASPGGQTPALGHTIRVYDHGTTNLVAGLVEPEIVNPQPISNPITVSGEFWGFQCPDPDAVAVDRDHRGGMAHAVPAHDGTGA